MYFFLLFFFTILFHKDMFCVKKKKKKSSKLKEPHITAFIALATMIKHVLTGLHNFRGSRISVLFFNISPLPILSLAKHLISCLDLLFFRAVEMVMFYRRRGSPSLRAAEHHPSRGRAFPAWCVTAFGFVLSCAQSVLSTGGEESSQRFLLRVIKFRREWILTPPRQELPLLLCKNYKCLPAGINSACHFGNQTVVP